eukprot:9559702-Ditylum_brightwellii.AAC.1
MKSQMSTVVSSAQKNQSMLPTQKKIRGRNVNLVVVMVMRGSYEDCVLIMDRKESQQVPPSDEKGREEHL